jgi:Na+/H+-dicarboxylate symporter
MTHAPDQPHATPPGGAWGLYLRTPLYLRIVAGLVAGVAVGLAMGEHAAHLRPVSDFVLKLLAALATPLIFCAVVHALAGAKATAGMGARMTWLLMSNTVVAILIGLLVANMLRPGDRVDLRPEDDKAGLTKKKPFDPIEDTIGKVPGNLVRPFVENDTLGIILIALALGVALRMVKTRQEAAGLTTYRAVEDALDTVFQCVMVLLHGVFHLVPLAVLAVVARLVGTQGFAPFIALGWFVLSVLLALGLMSLFYLGRLALGSWVRPWAFLRGSSDALLVAFSTASSAATLPVTFECVTEKIGVREESASLGVMVGGTFNHDGTALYEAMAALFISQVIGEPLGLAEQLIVVVMAIFASVGAAGIPEAGLVTMIAVFTAVQLPIQYIALLLTVDWFLDRCRTAINVMGDMCSTCLLDGRYPPPAPAPDPTAVPAQPPAASTAVTARAPQ